MARDRLLRNLIRERFHITLKSGETFDGLLDEWDAHHLTFIDAGTTVPAGDETKRVPVDGRLLLPRDNVAYLQAIQ